MPYVYGDNLNLNDRLEELEGYEESENEKDEDDTTVYLDEADKEELEALRALKEELGDDWDDTTLIPESEWREYAQTTAEDLGDIPDFLSNYIDWDKFADNLTSDYSTVKYEGTTYYYRA